MHLEKNGKLFPICHFSFNTQFLKEINIPEEEEYLDLENKSIKYLEY